MTEYIFDKWTDKYAKRTENMRSSTIRDLFSVTTRPDIISLAGGAPCVTRFENKNINEAMKRSLKDKTKSLQYGASEGIEDLRELILEFLAVENIEAYSEDILITGGTQQSLDLVSKVFIDPGDIILAEEPSYVGALNSFYVFQANVVQIPMDDNGLKVTELKKMLGNLPRKPKFLYTIPNYQNPSGVSLSGERRKQLVDVCKKNDILIIEDNAYSMLGFTKKKLPALRSLDENVVYMGTFSKVLFNPGARLGWILAPKAIMEKINFSKQAADLCTGQLSQYLALNYLQHNDWRSFIDEMRGFYKMKRDVMLRSLKKYFPKEATWTNPKGGLYIWVTLPGYLDSQKMLADAINEKVAFVPGKGFYSTDKGKCQMRLSYGVAEPAEIEEGIKRLAKVVKYNMELYALFNKK